MCHLTGLECWWVLSNVWVGGIKHLKGDLKMLALRVHGWHDAPNVTGPVQTAGCVCELAPCDLMLQSKFDTSAEGTTRVINNNKTSCPQTPKVIRNRFSPPPGWGVRQRKVLGLGRHVLSNLRCQLVLARGGRRSWRDGCTQLMCHKKIQSVFSFWFSEDGY